MTIRRFADLASGLIAPHTRVYDLGCGPGEITCELSRRHPLTVFVGLDHSETAIARAVENAKRLKLSNVHFQSADVSAYTFPERPDLILMFDAFHHVLEAKEFVRRLRLVCERFFLVEPAGSWYGGWRRELDFDWVVAELDSIRLHLESILQLGADRSPSVTVQSEALGRAVEQRYSIDDFEQLFSGLSIDVRGTVGGIEKYPPLPHGETPLKEQFGEFAYHVFSAIDSTLFQKDLDLFAKHWALSIHPGPPGVTREIGAAGPPPRDSERTRVQGPYDAAYSQYQGPSVIQVRATAFAGLTVSNRSWQTWGSGDVESVMLGYRWCRRNGEVIAEGPRTALPAPLPPGEDRRLPLRLEAPAEPGWYVLAIELVHEGVTWFSDAGIPPFMVNVRVKR